MTDWIPICIFVVIVVIAAMIITAEDEATRQARLRAKYEQELTRLTEQAEVTRAEVVVIRAQTELDQVLARQQYFRSLSKRERALLEARLRASAEAEARASYQLSQLEAENWRLTQQLGALTWNVRR
jgi:sensor domain CHASE-containing protein